VSVNQNLAIQLLRARIRPIQALTLNLLYYHYQVEDRTSALLSPVTSHAGAIEHRDFGDEVDLAVDWSANAHLEFSALLGVFEPAQGGRDFFGDDETWVGFMLAATVHF
jgi:hypothetical protein